MTNTSIASKRGLLSQVLTWLKQILNNDDLGISVRDKAEKEILVTKIRAIIRKDFPERLYLEKYTENSLRFTPLFDLRVILDKLEHPPGSAEADQTEEPPA